MGYGDDLLITTFASKIKKQYPERQIVIGSIKKKHAFHSIIYENNPNISNCEKLDLKKPIHIIDYHPGNRPYIDYKKSTNRKKSTSRHIDIRAKPIFSKCKRHIYRRSQTKDCCTLKYYLDKMDYFIKSHFIKSHC